MPLFAAKAIFLVLLGPLGVALTLAAAAAATAFPAVF